MFFMYRIDKDLKDYLRLSLLADLFETNDSDNSQIIADAILKGLEKYDILDDSMYAEIENIDYKADKNRDNMAA